MNYLVDFTKRPSRSKPTAHRLAKATGRTGAEENRSIFYPYSEGEGKRKGLPNILHNQFSTIQVLPNPLKTWNFLLPHFKSTNFRADTCDTRFFSLQFVAASKTFELLSFRTSKGWYLKILLITKSCITWKHRSISSRATIFLGITGRALLFSVR